MGPQIYRSVRQALKRFEQAGQIRRDWQRLSAMSDYQLNDIGMTRGDLFFRRRR